MVTVKIDVEGTETGFSLNPKTFSTGSTGFHGSTKVEGPDGVRYQAQVQLVEIGSRAKREKK